MEMFESESSLLDAIAAHDELVRRCVRGDISFDDFCREYNDFYAYYALDGHESDDEERELLLKHDAIIEPHRVIAYDILGRVCSDEDAQLEPYKQAGRFGSIEALRLLGHVRLGCSGKA
ncbi:MAG: hypothetical protein ABWY06_13010 [Pseudomonas sp.]|uniref:hypothetical protein n=1 Tax=Pseudomonas sp. TaxID=306 RepID=UPI003397465B